MWKQPEKASKYKNTCKKSYLPENTTIDNHQSESVVTMGTEVVAVVKGTVSPDLSAGSKMAEQTQDM